MILAAAAAVVGASSRKVRARSSAIFWMSSSDIGAVSMPMPFRRCRVARISFGLNASDSDPALDLARIGNDRGADMPGHHDRSI